MNIPTDAALALPMLVKLAPTRTVWTMIARTAHALHVEDPASVERLRPAIEAAFVSWPDGLREVPKDWAPTADTRQGWDHPLLWMADTLRLQWLFSGGKGEPEFDLEAMVTAPGLANIAVVDVLDLNRADRLRTFGTDQLGVLLDSNMASFRHLVGLQLSRTELEFVLGHERPLKGLGFNAPVGEVWGIPDLTEWDGVTRLERLEICNIREFGVHLKELCSRLDNVRHFALTNSLPDADTFDMAQVDPFENQYDMNDAIASIPGFEHRLEHLELHDNGIDSLSLSLSKGMAKLHTLDLESNPVGRGGLSNLDADKFPLLRILRANRCELTGHLVEHLRDTALLARLSELSLMHDDLSGNAALAIAESTELELTCLMLSGKIDDDGLRALATSNAFPKLLSCNLLEWGEEPSPEVIALVGLSPVLAPRVRPDDARAVDDWPERPAGGVTRIRTPGLTSLCKALGIKGYSKLKGDALTAAVRARLADGGLDTLRARSP